MPVLRDGEFVWRSSSRRPAAATIPLSARSSPSLVEAIDGQATVADIVARNAAGLDAETADHLVEAAFRTIEILYIDGIIADLRGL